MLGGIFHFYQKVAVTSYNKYYFVYLKKKIHVDRCSFGLSEEFLSFPPTVREIAQTGQATPQGDDCEIDSELDKQLEIAAEDLMRELHEECDRKERARCDRKERARISTGGLTGSSEGRNENVEGEQVDNSDIAGMRVDNRYYLLLFDQGATLSLARPRMAELDKDRLKEYSSVIRSVNGKVTPVIGVLNLMFEVNGESKLISVKRVSELDHDLILGMDFCKEFDIDARLARGSWRSNDGVDAVRR